MSIRPRSRARTFVEPRSKCKAMFSRRGWARAGIPHKTQGLRVKQIRSRSDQTACNYCLTLCVGRLSRHDMVIKIKFAPQSDHAFGPCRISAEQPKELPKDKFPGWFARSPRRFRGVSAGFPRGFRGVSAGSPRGFRGVSAGFPRGFPRGFRGFPWVSA